jgi:hypothetical protein
VILILRSNPARRPFAALDRLSGRPLPASGNQAQKARFRVHRDVLAPASIISARFVEPWHNNQSCTWKESCFQNGIFGSPEPCKQTDEIERRRSAGGYFQCFIRCLRAFPFFLSIHPTCRGENCAVCVPGPLRPENIWWSRGKHRLLTSVPGLGI